MKLNDQQLELLEFVKEKHGDQKRKYTGEPYWTHPLAVAIIVSEYASEAGIIEIALGHDLFEDTSCSEDELYDKLNELKYDRAVIDFIISGIDNLTDHYTSSRYPHLNREKRKEKEAERLGFQGEKIQSIKYADLIDNTASIVANDPNFAIVYLKEKRELLDYMRNGDINLFIKCCYTLYDAELKLKQQPA